jgi:ABC-type amino acid transport substrate-binding protein
VAGAEIVQHTNPYYRSTYVIVTPKDSPLAGVKALGDPKLKGHHIGAFAGTPPVDELLKKGLVDDAKFYELLVDHRFESPLATVISDLESKKIDAAVVWGPLIGLDVKKSGGELVMTPLLKEGDEPDYSFRITFGIRHNEPDWKHRLEAIIRARQSDINAVLNDYNVPLLDNAGKIIPPAAAASAQKTSTP